MSISDLLVASSQSLTLDFDQEAQWKANFLDAFQGEIPKAEWKLSFGAAKDHFLNNRYTEGIEQLSKIESRLISSPVNKIALRQLGEIESLRSNIAIASQNLALEIQSQERLAYFFEVFKDPLFQSRQSGMVAKRFRQILSKGVLISKWSEDTPIHQFNFFDSGPATEIQRALFQTRPEKYRYQDVQLTLGRKKFLLRAESQRQNDSQKLISDLEEAKATDERKSIWRSPWLWAGMGLIAGASGFAIYYSTRSSSARTR